MNYKNLNKKRFNILLLGVITTLVTLGFIFLPERVYLGIRELKFKDDVSVDNVEEIQNYPYNDLLAPSYVIYDNTDKKLIASKDNTKRPLASVTKLMTALVAMRSCKDQITISDKTMNKQTAVEMMLVESSNEIAEAIAAVCPNTEDFVQNMNRVSKDSGLDLTFRNPSGLDENNETEASAFGSPLDVAKLINKLYLEYPKILESTSYSVWQGVQNTNNHASNWPFLLGSKTGYTDVAHGNLAIIIEPSPNKRISIVVLGSTKEDRFTDVQKLMNWYLKRR